MLETRIRRMYLMGMVTIFMLAGLIMASKFSQTIDFIMQFILKD